MKVLIGCLNSKYVHASLSPWCLAAGIEEFCEREIKYTVKESTINSDIDKFAKEILAEKPDIVALSVYIWNVEKTLALCEFIKESSETKIVFGGPEVAFRPKDVLEKYPFIDFVLSGEGEFCFPLLLNTLYKNGDKTAVDGLTFRKGKEIISVPEKVYDIDPPSPYLPQFFENLNGRIAYIESSRGCPFSCDFCLSGRCSPLRFFDMKRTKSDILRLANSGTKTVKFVDRTFNSSKKHANEILSFIIENIGKEIPKGVCFHFEIAGDILSEETAELLKTAPKGLFQLEIGMQSFSEETLKKINRKTNTKKLIENVKRLVDFGNMHIHIDLIAGLLGEDLESFERSFNIGFSLKAHMLQMGFLKLLYGAKMREDTKKYTLEYSKNPPYEVISTPDLSKEELLSLKRCEDALERLYNSGRFLLTVEYLLLSLKISPFRLFFEFGGAVSGEGLPLYEYAGKIFEFYKEKTDSNILREKIVSDLLLSCKNPKIPNELKVYDKRYRVIKKHLTERYGKVPFAILDSEKEVLWVDTNSERDFYGRYQQNRVKIKDILGEI